jgi:hypothetical protein
MRTIVVFVLIIIMAACGGADKKTKTAAAPRKFEVLNISAKDAAKLAAVPFKCVMKEYPYRMGQTIGSEADLGSPSKLHPAFYGCTNWNSSVVAYLTMTRLLKKFPGLENADSVRQNLKERLSAANLQGEVMYFKGRYSKPFQRTAGWNSLLQLMKELHTWKDPLAKELEQNVKPLADLIENNYLEYLPKVEYSSRGTAAGFAVAYDYAKAMGKDSLRLMIERKCRAFYLDDKDRKLKNDKPDQDPAADFLQEADVMRRVLPQQEYRTWLAAFLPGLSDRDLKLEPSRPTERAARAGTDSSSAGKDSAATARKTAAPPEETESPELREPDMSRTDRANFTKAFCLLGIANELPEYEHLRSIAYELIIYSLPNVVTKDEIKLRLLQMNYMY